LYSIPWLVRISRILVAVDGSENADRAFEYAAYMAKQCEAEQLFIINVIQEFGRNIRAWEKHDSVVKEHASLYASVILSSSYIA
jgi:nucleotide-binding universal stress UspA family protein